MNWGSGVSRSVKSRTRFLHVEKDFDVSLWAQDDSKPLTGGGLLVPSNGLQEELQLHFLTALSALRNHYEVYDSLFPFDGGNVVVGSQHVFVGAETIEQTIRMF